MDLPADLARQIGVDPATLEETVRTFNAMAESGSDPAFGRGTTAYTASILGGEYAGAGIALGPALTFGFIAGQHIADESQSLRVVGAATPWAHAAAVA